MGNMILTIKNGKYEWKKAEVFSLEDYKKDKQNLPATPQKAVKKK